MAFSILCRWWAGQPAVPLRDSGGNSSKELTSLLGRRCNEKEDEKVIYKGLGETRMMMARGAISGYFSGGRGGQTINCHQARDF